MPGQFARRRNAVPVVDRFLPFLRIARLAGQSHFVHAADRLRPPGFVGLGIDPLEIGREALRRSIEDSFARQNFRPKLLAACIKAAMEEYQRRLEIYV